MACLALPRPAIAEEVEVQPVDGEAPANEAAGEHEFTTRAPAPAASTASETRVTARQFAAIPRRTAEDALRLVPGLVLVQHGNEGKGHQIFLRGFDASHGADFEITLEGIPLNEWSNIHAQGYLDLGFIIPELIRGVDVTRGPFTLNQGLFSIAGTAHYQLGVPSEERGLRSAYTLGTTNRHRALISYAPESGFGDDFIAGEALFDSGFGQNRRSRRASLMAQKRLDVNPAGDSIRLLASASAADFGLPGILRSDAFAAREIGFYDAYDDKTRGNGQRALLAAIYEAVRADSALKTLGYAGYRKLNLLENFTGFLNDPLHGDRRSQHEQHAQFGASIEFEQDLRTNLRLFLGAGARHEFFDQHEDHLSQQEQTLASIRHLSAHQTAAHLLAGIRWTPQSLRLDAGLRLDLLHFLLTAAGPEHLQPNDLPGTQLLAALSPRTTLAWRASNNLEWFAAFGRGIRPPEARAFLGNTEENQGLIDERFDGGQPAITASNTVEIGARYGSLDTLRLSLATFGTYVARESVFDHVSGLNIELNATRRLGAELVLSSRPLPWLTLRADATAVSARFVQSQRPVPLAPRWMGGLQGVVTHPSGLRAGIHGLGVLPRPLPHGARSSALVLLNGTLGWHWTHLRLDLDVENLLNLHAREGEYHFASHWNRERAASALPALHYVAASPRNARLTLTVVF